MERTISLPAHSGLSLTKTKADQSDIYRLTCAELFYGMMHEVFYSHKTMNLTEVREEMDEFVRWQDSYAGNPYTMIDRTFSKGFGINCLNRSAEKRYHKWKNKRIDHAVWPRTEKCPKQKLLATELLYAFYSEVLKQRVLFEIISVHVQSIFYDVVNQPLTDDVILHRVQYSCYERLEYYASNKTLVRYRQWLEYVTKSQ